MGWVDSMVISHEISIINDIDFKVLVHILHGESKKPQFSTAQGGNFVLIHDEKQPSFSVFRENPWDEKNYFIIVILAIISSLFLPWGGVMEESYAPFSCNFDINLDNKSQELTVISLKKILRTNTRSLKIWRNIAIIQFILLDVLLFGLLLSISFLFSPLFSWIVRFIGFTFFVMLAIRMKVHLKKVYSKYLDVLFEQPVLQSRNE